MGEIIKVKGVEPRRGVRVRTVIFIVLLIVTAVISFYPRNEIAFMGFTIYRPLLALILSIIVLFYFEAAIAPLLTTPTPTRRVRRRGR